MWVSRRNHLIFIVLISSSTSAYLFLVCCMKVLVEKIGVPSLKTGDESVIVNGGWMKLHECLCPWSSLIRYLVSKILVFYSNAVYNGVISTNGWASSLELFLIFIGNCDGSIGHCCKKRPSSLEWWMYIMCHGFLYDPTLSHIYEISSMHHQFFWIFPIWF